MKKTAQLLALSSLLITASVLPITADAASTTSKDKTKPTLTTTITAGNSGNGAKEVTLKVRAADNVRVKTLKYAEGNRTASYMKSNGKTLGTYFLSGDYYVKITKNGTYTFYVEDTNGNVTTKQVTVSNIDVTKPVITEAKHFYNLETTDDYIILNTSDNKKLKSVLVYLNGSTVSVNNSVNSTKFNKTVRLPSLKKGTHTVKIIVSDYAGNSVTKNITITKK